MDRPLHTGMITVSVMLATIMQALDTTIANVALPHMQGSLSATQEQASWILTSYIVAAAIMTAPTGLLAARMGRKRLMAICISGFTIASIFCGLATSLPEMVIFRLLQGVFGAGLVPLSQAIMLDITPPEKHGQAMALWGMGVMLGPILGPTLGGWLTEYYNWRWVFYINVPIGLVALFGVLSFLPETAKTNRRFDLFGFILLSLAIGGLQMMLDRGESKDWFSSPEIVIECILAGLGAYLFVVHILTTNKTPFVDPAMFRDRNYLVATIFIFIIGIILLSSMALLPPFLQNLMGYPVITTGLVLAPRGIGTLMAMMIVGRITQKADPRLLILFGLLTTAWSLQMMGEFTLDISTSMLVHSGLIQGFGMGFVFAPLTMLAYATLPQHYRNDAAAIFSLSRNIGSSVGISMVTVLLAQNIQVNHAELGAHLVPFGNMRLTLEAATERMGGSEADSALAWLDGAVNIQAATISYLNDFRLMMWIILLSAPLLLFIKKRPKAAAHQKEAEPLASAME